MATRYKCPKCGGIRIQPDIGKSFGYHSKGTTFIKQGHECFCDGEKKK